MDGMVPAGLAPSVPAPLGALRWAPGKVMALVLWAFVLNVAQASALRGLGVEDLSGNLPYFVRAVVVLAFYAAIAAPVVVSARRQQVGFRAAVGLRGSSVPKMVGLAVAAVFVARLIAAAWVLAAHQLGLKLPGGSVDITKIFGPSAFGVAVTVLVAVVVGPFVEEVVFRGVAFAQLDRVEGFAAGVFGSSLMFGLLHVDPLEFVPLVIAGAIFAWLFRATRSLWTAVLAHAVFNLVAVIAVYWLKAVS